MADQDLLQRGWAVRKLSPLFQRHSWDAAR